MRNQSMVAPKSTVLKVGMPADSNHFSFFERLPPLASNPAPSRMKSRTLIFENAKLNPELPEHPPDFEHTAAGPETDPVLANVSSSQPF